MSEEESKETEASAKESEVADTAVDDAILRAEERLKELEALFSKRYTDEDEEFVKIKSKPIPPPPVVHPWNVRQKRDDGGGRSDKWRNRDRWRGRNDYRGYRDDYRGYRDDYRGYRDNYRGYRERDRNQENNRRTSERFGRWIDWY